MVIFKGKKGKENIPIINKQLKKKNIRTFSLLLLFIIAINVLSSFLFTRIDLTTEKRYTLSKATKKILKNIDDVVYFKIYLEGDFPAGFKRLKNETREMLNQFKAYNTLIQYEFINPSEGKNKKQTNNIYKELYTKGIEPTNLQVKNNDGSSQQIIFPGAIVTYKEKELPLQLLNSQLGVAPEAILNSSIESLEYNIASVLKKLSLTTKPKIAFLQGHGELDKYETGSIAAMLSEYYDVNQITLLNNLNALDKIKALIIAKPNRIFSEKDKFIIDQFVMNGGKLIWLVNPVFASMDSLRTENQTIGISQKLGIEDQLFKYGVRLNYDLIQDLNAMPLPIKTGNMGNQPQFSYLPWYFFPVIMPTVKHPIVNNLNAVKFEFTSSIDTVGSSKIKKTILLTTSQYTRLIQTPVSISLDIMQEKPNEKAFNKSYIPTAVLLEGEFPSLFKNRLSDSMINQPNYHFKELSIPNKMIVISNGDVIKNEIQLTNGLKYPMPLGYDKYTRETFGNKEFILNCIDYLCDDSGLIDVRSRELKLRLLDKTKTAKYKTMIQFVNVGLPVLLILLFALVNGFIRKRKFSA
ncbi:MAG TPA: gliding motility-associated ABC transporter substrate-binding protein GldG [Bacteroidales bacterium]|nr:gliding motility-associated ABC transporter substrate-binding protein GldG [Bacteroidales bacterium]HPS45552.1 gliding motility-associated ABC transporter substrate-binding protein GldG [Bacteroidales bacterium]HQH18239.1 gliding motility-associated ABC transporter substrate-binding protein GldG [Bacteroidales bacterium]HQI45228.1 gliding motility-associated ABC transporter substrate-binding protein GldG [Bacteroidales bacterium]